MTTSYTPEAIARRKHRAKAMPGPSPKSRLAAAMVRIDSEYARTAASDAPRKCCSKCKTPFFCGNKGCRCHSF